MMRSVAALLSLPVSVQGHAYIYFPPMRGGAFNNLGNEYCPQCLGDTALPLPTCGKDSFLDHTSGPVTTLTAGQQLQVEIRVTAHHMGHFEFRLCDQTMSSAFATLADQEECLNQHVLERVRPENIHSDCTQNDERGDCQPFDEANPSYWYLPPASAGDAVLLEAAHSRSPTGAAFAEVKSHSDFNGIVYKIHYQLPEGVTCEKCTLQWWWSSANSCTPHPDAYRCYFQRMQSLGWRASDWCNGACEFDGTCPAVQGGATLCGEQFKNCADVQIVSGQVTQHGSEPPSPAPTSVAPTPAQLTPAPPMPEPESEPETSSTSTTAPSASGLVCTVNTALNRGVTQPDCDRCNTGYEHWPCNELGPEGDILCFCSESLLSASARRASVKEHRFLGLIQRSDELRAAAWSSQAQEEL